jgi:hypothetical protein
VTLGLIVFALGVANFVVALGLLLAARAHARRVVTRERARFAATDRKTWRVVVPLLDGVQGGSASHLAGLLLEAAPVGIDYTFRIRETRELELGRVRVSFEAGTKEPS